ncbi:hypothetical protein BSKO_04281 [Bryopsis sp. KO-2023]|nr:hypothetical protein BSKO_04281 [Bryopsis sp. KO-2023]
MISNALAPGSLAPCCFSSHLSRFRSGSKLSNPLTKRTKPCPARIATSCSFVSTSSPPLIPRIPGPGQARLEKRTHRGGLQVTNAIFGVGAPEAILVGVVALVVFGPKGLAEAAKSLGKAVRSFQPTIRELAEVSTDLRSTLEQEIGLEEIRDDFQSLRNPLSTSPTKSYKDSSVTPLAEEKVKAIDPDIETKRAKAAEMAWGGSSGSVPPVLEAEIIPEKVKSEEKVESKGKSPDSLSGLSTAELEAELKKRKSKSDQKSA